MNGFGPNTIWLVVVLVAIAGTLASRRLSLATWLRGILGWAAIALVVLLLVSHRYQIQNFFAAIGDRLGISSQQVVGDAVRIRMSPDGHFYARVTLNGISRMMLIDSGATTTALSEATAQAAGITPDSDFPVLLSTANGTVLAKHGTVEKLAIGSLRTDNLGVVVASNFGDLDVLGMNFLSRLGSWRVEGQTLILEPPAVADTSSI
ncbi:retropepsin-like aspartic protease family protein [Sphingosinithalassobacter portus]|uniref:retropepsin-like aspartic protease family protein n=1 Tax=Stakelama portus TaxID=2676234 RepID=UPI000D6E8E7C|nr:TIGR02281 family clan AA aspartic protease [Sphingosinithalassobacter portus]